MNHLLLTSASSVSVIFLMMSPGKVTKTDLRGRLHPSWMLIPTIKITAKPQHLMMRPMLAFYKNVYILRAFEVSSAQLDKKDEKAVLLWQRWLLSLLWLGALVVSSLCSWVSDLVFIHCKILVTWPRPHSPLTSTLPLTPSQNARWMNRGISKMSKFSLSWQVVSSELMVLVGRTSSWRRWRKAVVDETNYSTV